MLIPTGGLLTWRRNLARRQHAQQTEPAWWDRPLAGTSSTSREHFAYLALRAGPSCPAKHRAQEKKLRNKIARTLVCMNKCS